MTDPNGQHPGPSGYLIFDKPLGRTSMDLCRVVKRALVLGGARKRVRVGHAGTLDPLATGVVIVLTGSYTRRCERVMASAKRYEAEVDLLNFSTTDDLEGRLTPVEVGTPPTPTQVEDACAKFQGTIMQRPPIFSALKLDGQSAYRLARKADRLEARDELTPGAAERLEILKKRLDLPERPVRIDRVEVVEYAFPRLRLAIDCGKGVYIRSLARDVGTALGTGGMLTALRRTRVGAYTIERAITPDALPRVMTQEHLLVDEPDPSA
jgi:tRNA pseudouridine55 synthase